MELPVRPAERIRRRRLRGHRATRDPGRYDGRGLLNC